MYLFVYLVVLLVSWCALGVFLYMATALFEMRPSPMTVMEALAQLERTTAEGLAILEARKEKIRNATLPELQLMFNLRHQIA
jgi:hypothetical protein